MYSLEEKPEKFGNRTRVEILASILNVAAHGALKTHIMYKANLSHKQLGKYLDFLVVNALLEIVEAEIGTHYYRVTERGIQFLKDYERIASYMT